MDFFLERMQDLLGDKYPLFLDSLDKRAYRGLRVNTLKTSSDLVLEKLNNLKEEISFYHDAYYLEDDEEKIGNHPLHHCGGIYIQEPSAMSAVKMLDVKKGDTVLDLCAAPGSKTTQIAQELDGTGLLVSNEIVSKRASILLSNIERMGVKNCVVLNTSPETLCPRLEKYFDKILVDAPCSGEGMFRKDPDARKEWSVEHVKSCADRQLKILESAKTSLKPGGTLVYSTCTFSKEENEGVIEKFLENNKDFTLVEKKRIFPFDKGEGHFAAKLVKAGESEQSVYNKEEIKDKEIKEFLDDILVENNVKNIEVVNDVIYSLPFEKERLTDFTSLGLIRAGVKVGEIKKGRIEPSHHFFSTLRKSEVKNVANLSLTDERLLKFLHGEEVDIDKDIKGYTLVCVEGISLSFGKASNGKLKNKYPKGLRING